jgi:hypothetical protein
MEPEAECIPLADQPGDHRFHHLSVWRNLDSHMVQIRPVCISRLLVSSFTRSGKVSIIVQVASGSHSLLPKRHSPAKNFSMTGQPL